MVQIQGKRFSATYTEDHGLTQMYVRVQIGRHDPNSRLVQYLLGEFQLCVIVIWFPSTLPEGIAGQEPILLWVPAHVLQRHGSMMSEEDSKKHQADSLSALPPSPAPEVRVRLGLVKAIQSGAPIAHPLCPPVTSRHEATVPRPELQDADLL